VDDFFQVLYAQAASSGEVAGDDSADGVFVAQPSPKGARYSVDNLASLLQTADRVSIAISFVLIAIAF